MPQEFFIPQSNRQGYDGDGDFRAYVRNILEGQYSGAAGIQPGDTLYVAAKDILAIEGRLNDLGKNGVIVLSHEAYHESLKPEPLSPPAP